MFDPDPDRGVLAFAVAVLAAWMALSAVRPIVDFQVDERGVTMHLGLGSEVAQAAWQRLCLRP
jgi:hypothetical protein